MGLDKACVRGVVGNVLMVVWLLVLGVVIGNCTETSTPLTPPTPATTTAIEQTGEAANKILTVSEIDQLKTEKLILEFQLLNRQLGDIQQRQAMIANDPLIKKWKAEQARKQTEMKTEPVKPEPVKPEPVKPEPVKPEPKPKKGEKK